MARFLNLFVVVYSMSQKIFLGVVWMKRKIRIVKGLFGQFFGQLKGLFSQFLCPIKGLFRLFCGHFTCHTLP